jgi:hypothetical protein
MDETIAQHERYKERQRSNLCLQHPQLNPGDSRFPTLHGIGSEFAPQYKYVGNTKAN